MSTPRLLLLAAAALALTLPIVARAQDPAQVEALAPLLMADDRRDFDLAILTGGTNDPDPLVRQTAVTTIGHIGDLRGTALLLPRLADADPGVITATFFAMGLLRDTATVEPIITRLRSPDTLSSDAVGEAATALARIGGSAAARFIGGALTGTGDLAPGRRNAFILAALQDGWRLGSLMPVAAMMRFANDTSFDLRSRLLWSLGHQRSAAGGRALLAALRDQVPALREIAARWLDRSLSEAAGLAPRTVESELVRLLDDEQPGVRVNAIAALVTFNDSTLASRIVPILSDADPNVRVAAATALGTFHDAATVHALAGAFDRKDANWALRDAALNALARSDTAGFAPRARLWQASADPRERVTALRAWARVAGADITPFRAAITDLDGRVQAAALDAWSAATPRDSALHAAALARLSAADANIRASAARALSATAQAADLSALVAAWRRSAADRDPNARLAILAALHQLVLRSPDLFAQFDEPDGRIMFDRPDDPVVRAAGARSWPELAQRWGDARPIATTRTIEDYRGIARTYLLGTANVQVTIDIVGRGTIDVELLGHEAPLTVANFLRLVDQHFFDGGRWFEVVPNQVALAGDKSGTGNGGPGWTIRDEVNRERFTLPVLSMALDGPDTGGSQFFFNLTTEPERDGVYTVFGRVSGSYVALTKITEGDVIRSVHR
jgi:cyclophilin family peptidyl-prolyl cis-trans isomerase